MNVLISWESVDLFIERCAPSKTHCMKDFDKKKKHTITHVVKTQLTIDCFYDIVLHKTSQDV